MYPLIVTRYIFFALFIAFNVCIATVAAWNLGTSQSAGAVSPVDAYLIALPIMGILLIFPIIFIDLFRRGAFTSRVWFETAWVALFWVMHLAGAAAVSAVQPGMQCVSPDLPWTSLCNSSKALMAFTWMTTIALLAYLLTLLICTILNMRDMPRIWSTGVTEVDWFGAEPKRISSPPGSPRLAPSMIEKPVSHARPLYIVQAQPAKLVPAPKPQPGPMFPPKPRSVTAVAAPAPPSTATVTPPLYPQFIQPHVVIRPVLPHGPEPQPAGQWPPPSRGGHSHSASVGDVSSARVDPRSGLRPLQLQTSSMTQARVQATTASPVSTTPRTLREKRRPPPLNLSAVSSFNDRTVRR